MKKTTLVLSLLITSCTLYAQKKNPKTIFEVFGTISTPCAIEKNNSDDLQVAAAIMDAGADLRDAASIKKTETELLAAEKTIAQHFANIGLNNNINVRLYDFSKGGYLHQQENNYILYAKDGKIIWKKDFLYTEKTYHDKEGFNVYGRGPLAAYYDQSGKLISDGQFEYIEHMYGDYFRTLKNKKWGIILRNGKQVLPTEYNSLSYFRSDNKFYYIVSEDENSYYLTQDLKTKIPIPYYGEMPKLIKNRYWLIMGHLYDPVARKQLFCGLPYIERVNNSDILLVKKGRENYYFDIQGNILADNKINFLNAVDSVFFIATMKEPKDTTIARRKITLHKYALVKRVGDKIQWITKPDYYAIRHEFRQKFFWFSSTPGSQKYGLLDLKGKVIVPDGIYSSIKATPKADMVLAITDSASLVINTRTGAKIRLKQPYTNLSRVDRDGSFIAGETKSGTYVLDSGFNIIDFPVFSSLAYYYPPALFVGTLTGKNTAQKMFFDKNGQVFKFTWNDTTYTSFKELSKLEENHLFIELADGRNFLQLGKDKYMQTIYENVFYDPVAKWYVGHTPGSHHLFGTFDSTGAIIIPFVCTFIGNISPGQNQFNVSLDFDNSQRITTNGDVVLDLKYDNVSPFYNDAYLVTKGDRKGVVNQNGKEIVPVRYDHVSLEYGKIIAHSGGYRETYDLQLLFQE